MYSLLIQRNGDDHTTAWYFDSIEQFQLALKHCKAHAATVSEGAASTQGKPPAGDYITDAEELRVWLAFEYIVEDDAEGCA